MSWGQPLSLADVDQLVQTLGPLTEEQLKTLRAQLCPGDVSVGDTLEDVLLYWIEHESNPTRPLLQQKLQALVPESEGAELPDESKPGIVKRFLGAFSERGKRLVKNAEIKDLIDKCGKGNREAVGDLLTKVKPNVVDNRQTPLLAASLMGHLDIVKDLVAAKADVNFVTEGRAGRPALNAACSRGRYEVAEYLLDQGASVNATDGDQFSALHEATFNGHPRVAKLLIERGADIEKKSNDGSTALMVASEGGDVDTVKLLLEHRANSSHRLPKWGRTAIHSAASRGKAKVVELLLEAADCPIDDQDSAGATPLIMALIGNTPGKVARARAGYLETVKFLVGAGANLNIQDKTGKTVLMFAAKDNRLEEAKVLVEAGADLNIQDQEKGWSAIFFAAEKADVPMAQLLCEAGANLDLRNKKKKSVLDVAKTYSPTIHEMLEKASQRKVNLGRIKAEKRLILKNKELRMTLQPWNNNVH
ncbi:Ankyrin repeat domain-containing protein 50 [Geodia barretti]|uniref:Ankyrin repeat domain-containing protein 50 n=1 Tax=Geodia barretti TaxID=519541 RepID=A0AA35XGD4_GEOBA|nr:Ankyrin repeat domain-containing protein 50 [Geodia barretti]